MGAWSYGWNNFHSRNESKYLLLGQSVSLASSIFAFLLAANFTESLIRFDDGLLINTTLSNRYAAFVIIIAVLSFISSLFFFLMTLRTFFQTKKKDVALMLAVGGLIEKITDRLIAEILIISLLSCLLSILIGNFLFFFVSIYLSILNFDVFIQVSFMDMLTISLIFVLTFLILSYIFASIIVVRSIKKFYTEILSGEIQPELKLPIWISFFIPSTKANKIVHKLARINFSRTFYLVKSHFLSLIMLTAIFSSVLFGTFSVKDSTIQAMNQGIGDENLYVIVDPKLENFVRDGYSLFSPTNLTINLLNYSFSENNVREILNSEKITNNNIEFKIITLVSVLGIYERYISDNQYSILTKRGDTFLIGQSMKDSFSNWQFFGKDPKSLNENQIAVGESTAWEILNNPLENKEQLQINKSAIRFSVETMLIDPFLKGKTVYISTQQMISIFNLNSNLRNFAIVKINSTNNFIRISEKLNNLEIPLTLIPLDPIIDRNIEFQNSLGNILLLIIFPTILAYIIAVIIYTTTIIDIRRNILQILKSLGANMKVIEVSVSKEIWGMVFWGFFIGSLFGLVFILGLVIPQSVISFIAVFWYLTILIITGLVIKYLITHYIENYYKNFLY
ncbi:MAG: hypothetical protein HeimC3_45040 [Candidatus Heimdallarchaeota archaeon LC_3]|nr:MAG: hypothetical protein HeimC3_45040 [Candidatus Heimdallarchaeota archaeon LC_3]